MNKVLKKVIAWRIISTIVGIGLTFLFIGEVKKSIIMTITFVVVMTILHYIFEKNWEKLFNSKE